MKKIDGKECKLEFFDFCSEEEYFPSRQWRMHEGDGFLLIYSFNSRKSFEYLEILRKQIQTEREEEVTPIILVGNKIRSEDDVVVTKQEGEELAKNWGVPFFETYSFKNVTHEEVFFQLVRQIMKQREELIKPKKKNEGCLLF